MAKRAISLLRFSTPEQRKGDSTRRQDSWATEECKKHGWTLDETLRVEGISAFRGQHRIKGAFAEFLTKAKAGKIKPGTVLLVENLDRLSREEINDAFDLWRDILKAGIEIHTPTDHFTKSDLNELVKLIVVITLLSRGHEESRSKQYRQRENWKAKRATIKEKKLTARCPSWLQLNEDRKTFRKIPQAVQAVKVIFKLAVQGWGASAITRHLNQQHIQPIGRVDTWHRSYVLKILKNPAVIGEFHPHLGRPGSRTPLEPVPGYYPAIISPDVFWRAQKALQSRYQQRGPEGKKVANLFTGLVFDARDKGTMTVVDKGSKSVPKIVSARAQRGVSGSKYLSFPYQAFQNAILSHISELKASDIIPGADDSGAILEGLGAELESLERKLEKYQVSLLEEESETILKVVRQLEKRKKVLATQIEQTQEQPSELSTTKSLLLTLAQTTGDKLVEVRRAIKAQIPRLVESIWVLVWDYDGERLADIQINYHGGETRWIMVDRTGRNVAVTRKRILPPKTDLRQFNFQAKIAG